MRAPLPEKRPWSSPPGWICLYSLYFAQSKLWFLLPLMTLVLGAEVGVDVDAEFFEAISQMNMITDETFSVSIKACCGLLVGTVRPKPMVGSGNISSCVLAYPPCVILLQSLGLNGIRSLVAFSCLLMFRCFSGGFTLKNPKGDVPSLPAPV